MKLLKKTIAFLLFNIIVLFISFPLLTSFGPYKPLKELVIQTLIETRTGYRVLALFLTKDKINLLKNSAMPVDVDNRDKNPLKINPPKGGSGIDVTKTETDKFTYYVMLIHDPTRVKVAVSDKLGKSGERVSDMANRLNAIAAINGGGFLDYGIKDNGALPTGTTISDGKEILVVQHPSDYVIGLNDKGALLIGNYSYQEVKELKIQNCLGFIGPVLIRNGNPLKIGNSGLNPRTAIGQRADGTIIFLVIDGRSLKSQGATYRDVQLLMEKYGAYNAVNLDGGYSSTMFYDGELINNPSSPLGERYVATAFVVLP